MRGDFTPELARFVTNARAFGEFYGAHVRWQVGGRVSATDLLAAYLRWASQKCRPSLSFIDLRREMRAFGHRHKMSNGAWYMDAELRHVGSIGISDPASGPPDELVSAKIDGIIASLAALRLQISR